MKMRFAWLAAALLLTACEGGGDFMQKPADNKELSLADNYRRSGQFDQAISAYDAILDKDPESISAKEGKGLALLATGDFQTPTPLFQEVIKEDPKRWKTLNAIGILFAARDMNKEAQAYFDEALKYNPESASILNNSGMAQAIDGHYDLALASLTRAAGLAQPYSPELRRIDLNTAAVYAIDGKLEEARSLAGKYYSGAALDHTVDVYSHLAQDPTLAKNYLMTSLMESKVYSPGASEHLPH